MILELGQSGETVKNEKEEEEDGKEEEEKKKLNNNIRKEFHAPTKKEVKIETKGTNRDNRKRRNYSYTHIQIE